MKRSDGLWRFACGDVFYYWWLIMIMIMVITMSMIISISMMILVSLISAALSRHHVHDDDNLVDVSSIVVTPINAQPPSWWWGWQFLWWRCQKGWRQWWWWSWTHPDPSFVFISICWYFLLSADIATTVYLNFYRRHLNMKHNIRDTKSTQDDKTDIISNNTQVEKPVLKWNHPM